MLITPGVFAIGWLIIYMIGKGKNWARIISLVGFILGMPFVILLLAFSAPNPIYGFLGLGQMVLPLIALIFLFQKSSSDWFKDIQTFPSPRQQTIAEEKRVKTIDRGREEEEEGIFETRCYEILELQPGASAEAIRKAYEALIKIWSEEGFRNDPHLQKIASQRLKEINLAYKGLIK